MFNLMFFLEQLYSETQLGIKSGMDFDLQMWFDYEALQIRWFGLLHHFLPDILSKKLR